MNIFLGIGGNLGSRKANIDKTIELIGKKIGIPVKISSVYMSEPWGFVHSRYFTNAVVELNTDLSPAEIMTAISEIELEMKRERTKNTYEGRTMDIDILFYGSDIIKDHSLEIPHNKLHERLFVLLPLNEIAPDFVHPVLNKSIKELLESCNDKLQIRKLNYGS